MSQAAASLSHGHVPVAALRLLGDEALAQRVADGDGQAFAALYRRHHQALYRYCRAILGNAEDAADALQNTMAAALRALPGEQRELRIKPWLYRIAHNETISLARRRPPYTGLEQAMEVPDARGSDPATRERLRQLFADLPALPRVPAVDRRAPARPRRAGAAPPRARGGLDPARPRGRRTCRRGERPGGPCRRRYRQSGGHLRGGEGRGGGCRGRDRRHRDRRTDGQPTRRRRSQDAPRGRRRRTQRVARGRAQRHAAQFGAQAVGWRDLFAKRANAFETARQGPGPGPPPGDRQRQTQRQGTVA